MEGSELDDMTDEELEGIPPIGLIMKSAGVDMKEMIREGEDAKLRLLRIEAMLIAICGKAHIDKIDVAGETWVKQSGSDTPPSQ